MKHAPVVGYEGKLYLIDGDVWRVACADSDGIELHKVNTWQTMSLTTEKFAEFRDNSIGSYA